MNKNYLPKTEEHKINISKSLKGRKKSEEHKQKIKETLKRLYQEGKLNSQFKKGNENISSNNWKLYKQIYGNNKFELVCNKKSKENNPNWKGGIAFEPYTLDFNEEFKERIRSRDNYCCIICNKAQEELGYRLHVHHIDYDKTNSFPQNCASLCRRNHIETNFNRQAWTKFLQSLLKERYGYEYTEDQKIILDFTG